jgi:GNAT superfamily N-acetyltransferase
MISIRRMTTEDVPVARMLLSQLGYPLDTQEVLRRYEAVTGAEDHALMVAEQAGQVIAWCHLYVRPALDKPPEAVVQALVVGVGRIVMAAAEAWARDRGFVSVALASNVTRAGAHAFYEAIGYQRTATAHLFRKTLK